MIETSISEGYDPTLDEILDLNWRKLATGPRGDLLVRQNILESFILTTSKQVQADNEEIQAMAISNETMTRRIQHSERRVQLRKAHKALRAVQKELQRRSR